MRTNIDIDDALMTAAQEATGLSTKRAVVEEGLRTLVRLREQQGLRALRGRIGFVDEPPEVGAPDDGEQAVRERPVGGNLVVRDPPRDVGEGASSRIKSRTMPIKPQAPRTKGGVKGAAGGDDRRRR